MKTGRIKEEHRNRYVLQTDGGDISATAKGKLFLEHSLGESVIPKVGDYVNFEMVDDENAVITEILPRKNSFVRRNAHDKTPQVIVSNVDYGIIVQGLDGDFNVKRLERYIQLVENGGATPIIVLNKSDLIENEKEYIEKVRDSMPEIKVFFISAKKGTGMEEFSKVFVKGETSVFLGSSGAGKSTITNYLLEFEKQATKDVREDDSRGRHTTTSRQLFELPNGSYIIDTPGMRELSLLEEEDTTELFRDIKELSMSCKFGDCDHEKSAGCAILSAIENDEISRSHFDNYLKLKRESEFESHKVDTEGARIEKSKKKQLAKAIKRVKEQKRFEEKG